MPVNVKPVRRPAYGSRLAATYFPSILKGMWIAFRHLFRHKVTMQYPEEKWTLPDAFRGLLRTPGVRTVKPPLSANNDETPDPSRITVGRWKVTHDDQRYEHISSGPAGGAGGA